jgi:threonine dehydratase
VRYESIGDAIGGTPLVRVDALLPEAARAKGIHLYAKVELLGPTGSIKDRTAKALIDDLLFKGLLAPGKELIEPTSGNTGAALAVHAAARGIPLTLVMPANVTEERRAGGRTAPSSWRERWRPQIPNTSRPTSTGTRRIRRSMRSPRRRKSWPTCPR